MLARIVDRRYVSGLAFAGIAVGALGALITLNGASRHLGGLLAMPGLAIFALRGSQPRPAGDELTLLRPEDVEAISVARAAQGWSVGIQRKNGKVFFVELETRADARTLVRRLGRSTKNHAISIRGEGAPLVAIQAVFAALSIVTALQFSSADASGSALLSQVLAATVAVLTIMRVRGHLVARRNATEQLRRSAFASRTPWDAHALLHLFGDVVPPEQLGTVEDGTPVHATLARGEDGTSEWLSRLDDLAAPGGGAYRDRIDEPTLRELVLDESVEIDRRMAAARILKKRARVTIDNQVKDEAARIRIAAINEEDDAAERIEKLGPFFRAE